MEVVAGSHVGDMEGEEDEDVGEVDLADKVGKADEEGAYEDAWYPLHHSHLSFQVRAGLLLLEEPPQKQQEWSLLSAYLEEASIQIKEVA